MNAQAAGAVAAIVYDDVYESLIIMSKPKGHPDPDIPSVFVSEKAGILMRKLMTLDVIRVRLTPVGLLGGWLSAGGRAGGWAATRVYAACPGCSLVRCGTCFTLFLSSAAPHLPGACETRRCLPWVYS